MELLIRNIKKLMGKLQSTVLIKVIQFKEAVMEMGVERPSTLLARRINLN